MRKNKIKISETALLVIDVINDCCHKKGESPKWGITYNRIRRIVPKLEKFISKYRDSGGQVILVNCSPWRKEFLAKNIVELYKDPKCRYYSTDNSGFGEQFFKLKKGKNDFILTKNTHDAFSNPSLDKLLKKHKIKYLIITGVFGDGCVDSTIKVGFSAGYNFIILKDLIETTDLPIRQKLQKLLKEYTWPILFGKTINSQDFFNLVK